MAERAGEQTGTEEAAAEAAPAKDRPPKRRAARARAAKAAAAAEAPGPGMKVSKSGRVKRKRAPRSAYLPRPEASASAAEAAMRDEFFLPGRRVEGWFVRRSDVLMVTFDNTTSIGAYEPAQPWLMGRALKMEVSVLGLMAKRRDWYRNAESQEMIAALRDAGFFARFRRVVFIGTSMGGFAALTLSALVPGAAVVALSPQSTLAPDLAPFDQRYPKYAKKLDWQDLPLRDAAETVAPASEVWLVYDPFTPEDLAHAGRIGGDHIRRLHINFLGHRLMRALRRTDLLNGLVEGLVKGTLDPAGARRLLRQRRGIEAWQTALLAAGERAGHMALTARAARRILALHPDRRFARKTARSLERRLGASGGKYREPAGDSRRVIAHPEPAPPFTGEILTLSEALVVPERDHDQPRASGVLHHDGRWCELSRAWIRANKVSPAPLLARDEPVGDLPGTHLYAGHFRGHFGHFLVESTARLWALDHLDEKPDSILYLPYRGDVAGGERAIRSQRKFFELLGIDIPIRSLEFTRRVERLIVPELGFGWLERYAGSPAYRAFMQTRLSGAAPAEGAEDLYISRARLNAARGGILGETVIEDNLARLGYEIFHPEKHPLEVQIARYKAARRIVALDGSALHLAAYVLRPQSRVAMILRRSLANVADYDLQFRSFCGVVPDVINVIRRDWVAGEATRADFRSVGEIGFAALFGRLKDLGYVPPDFRPDLPGEAAIRAMLEAFENRRDQPFRALTPGERHGDEDE